MTTFSALTTLPAKEPADALAEAMEAFLPEPVGIGVFEIEDGSGRFEVGAYFEEEPDPTELALMAAIERGQGHGMVPAHGVTTIFYLLERARDAAFGREGVERLIGVFAVAPGR